MLARWPPLLTALHLPSSKSPRRLAWLGPHDQIQFGHPQQQALTLLPGPRQPANNEGEIG